MGFDKWTAKTPYAVSVGLSYHAIAYGNNEFVVVGPKTIIRSQNGGEKWFNDTVTSGTNSTGVYYSVAYGGGVFVAVGDHRTRWDGTTWSLPISQTVMGITTYLRAIAYGNGRFVAVGDAGTVVVSPDGLNWTTGASGTSKALKPIAFGNQRFVMADEDGIILTSVDGLTWSKAWNAASPLRVLTFAGNGFLGVDGAKKIVASADGLTWTAVPSTGLASFAAVDLVHAFGTFVVVGANGAIRTSPDGVNWTSQQSGSTQYLDGIAYGRKRFVAVGGTHIVRSGEYPSANLSALTCSAGQLTPLFNPFTTAYDATVNDGVASVTATSADPQAVIRVRLDSGSDVVVASGTPSAAEQFGGRIRTFSITVTARDNATKVYAVGIRMERPLANWPGGPIPFPKP